MLKATFAVGCTVVAAALAGYLVGLSNGSEIGYNVALERMREEVRVACPSWFVGAKGSDKQTRDIVACRRMAWMQ